LNKTGDAMLKREKLNKLVVMTLESEDMKAIKLFNTISNENPQVLREERVSSFRGFCKICNSFPEVEHTRTWKPYIYTLKKKL
jgi:hypothetical protein